MIMQTYGVCVIARKGLNLSKKGLQEPEKGVKQPEKGPFYGFQGVNIQ